MPCHDPGAHDEAQSEIQIWPSQATRSSQPPGEHGSSSREVPSAGSRRRGPTFFLEVFAGCSRLSRAVLDVGLRVACPIEVTNGKQFDVQDRRVLRVLLGWIASGTIWCLFLAPPCSRWSAARATPASGSAACAGLACAKATTELLAAAAAAGTMVIVENPASSSLWRWRPMAGALRRLGCRMFSFDACGFGAAWKKPTVLASNMDLSFIERRCRRDHQHVPLQGLVRTGSGPWRWRTSFASAYAPELCRGLAAGLCDAASVAAKARADNAIDSKWGRELASATGAEYFHMELPAVPHRFQLGWESATEQWGGRTLEFDLAACRHSRRATQTSSWTAASTSQ